jgi:hypothetical protein
MKGLRRRWKFRSRRQNAHAHSGWNIPSQCKRECDDDRTIGTLPQTTDRCAQNIRRKRPRTCQFVFSPEAIDDFNSIYISVSAWSSALKVAPMTIRKNDDCNERDTVGARPYKSERE